MCRQDDTFIIIFTDLPYTLRTETGPTLDAGTTGTVYVQMLDSHGNSCVERALGSTDMYGFPAFQDPTPAIPFDQDGGPASQVNQ